MFLIIMLDKILSASEKAENRITTEDKSTNTPEKKLSCSIQNTAFGERS